MTAPTPDHPPEMEPWRLEPARDHGLSLPERARSLQRESGLFQTFTHHLWWGGIRCYLALWHRFTVRHAGALPPDPPYILVANHASHLDAMCLAAPLPARFRDRVFPIAAGDVFFNTPAIAVFAAGLLNALPMWRKNCGPHALAQLRERLIRERCIYILFPEGARSRDGALLPFKAGIGMLVAGTSIPVVPCYLDGPFRAMPAGRAIPCPTRLTLRIGTPMDFSRVPDDREGWNLIAAELKRAIQSLADGE